METGNLMIDAQTAFARQRRRGRRERAARVLMRRKRGASCLAWLEHALGAAAPAGRRVVGVHTIPLASIVGTAEPAKARSFDHSFRPSAASRRRWERLWVAARRGATLPPISVFRLGEQHFVDDGHHRVSVARALGMTAIDAEVTDLGRPRAPSAQTHPGEA
jgi:hypothetical protein